VIVQLKGVVDQANGDVAQTVNPQPHCVPVDEENQKNEIRHTVERYKFLGGPTSGVMASIRS